MKKITYLFLAILLVSCAQKQEIAPKSADEIRAELNAYAREKGLEINEFYLREDLTQRQVIPSEQEIQQMKRLIDTIAYTKKHLVQIPGLLTAEKRIAIIKEIHKAIEEENQEVYDELMKKYETHQGNSMKKGDEDYPFKDIKKFKASPTFKDRKDFEAMYL